MAKAPLKGIFTPNLIPYTVDGGINEQELRRYADWLVERGVHGLYPKDRNSKRLNSSHL